MNIFYTSIATITKINFLQRWSLFSSSSGEFFSHFFDFKCIYFLLIYNTYLINSSSKSIFIEIGVVLFVRCDYHGKRGANSIDQINGYFCAALIVFSLSLFHSLVLGQFNYHFQWALVFVLILFTLRDRFPFSMHLSAIILIQFKLKTFIGNWRMGCWFHRFIPCKWMFSQFLIIHKSCAINTELKMSSVRV